MIWAPTKTKFLWGKKQNPPLWGGFCDTALLRRAASAASRRREPECRATGVYQMKRGPHRIVDSVGKCKTRPMGRVLLIEKGSTQI